jgi:hypothetical protein
MILKYRTIYWANSIYYIRLKIRFEKLTKYFNVKREPIDKLYVKELHIRENKDLVEKYFPL